MEIAAHDTATAATTATTALTKEQAERELSGRVYEHGFYTDVDAEQAPKGLNEEIIRLISRKKDEPEFMLDFRLKAFRRWQEMEDPWWRPVDHPDIDYQDIRYYSAPKSVDEKQGPASLDEVDPEILRTFERLGVPLMEQKRVMGVAVDAVFDSVSVGTTNQEQLTRLGIVFCSITEAAQGASRSGAALSRLGGAGGGQLLLRPQCGGIHRRVVLLHPAGGAVPDRPVHLLPHQRRRDRPVRAHPDCGRPRQLGELRGRLHRADARREPVARRGGGDRGARRRGGELLHGAETGTAATPTARAASTTSSPSAARRRGATRKSPGRRWRRERRSPGSTRA